MLSKLVTVARYLGELGYVIGREGNISIRKNGEVYIKASGAYLGMAKEGDFVKVGLDGSYSGRREPSIELPMHLAIYRAREDVKAIIHSHPTYLTTLSILDIPIRPLTAESEIYLKGRLGVVGRLPAGSDELAREVEREVRKGANLVVLRAHGLVALGSDLEEALERTIATERAAHIIYNLYRLKGSK